SWRRGQTCLLTAIRVHHVDLRAAAPSVRHERDRRAAGRPRQECVGPWRCGERALAAAIGIHQVDLGIAFLSPDERDTAAVGRPHRDCTLSGRTGKLLQSSAIGVDGKDLDGYALGGDKCEPLSLWSQSLKGAMRDLP